MRALLGILILGGLFLAAASWQRSQTNSLRAQRRAEYGLPTSSGELHANAEWSVLVLGRPSGAAPLRGPGPPRGGALAAGSEPAQEDGGGGERNPREVAPDARHEVRSGEYLGGICGQHYGTSKPALVEAVARYNGLASPDAIRAGDRLLLPDRALLGH